MRFFCLLFIPILATPQGNCDCIDALEIKNSLVHTFTSNGAGKLKEISETNDKSLYFFELEHNTGWYKFQIRADGDLTLTINPENGKDDIDFILFKYDFDGFCDRIKSKKLLPVRSNLARSGMGNPSETGLKADAGQDFAHSGPGNPFSNTLSVKKDEVFYLVVDNVHSTGEYTLQIDLGEKRLKKPEVTDEKYVELKTPFRVKVMDDATGAPLVCNFDMAGYQIGEPFRVSQRSEYTFDLSSSQNITLNCNAQGYIFYTKAMMAPPIPYDAKRNPDTVNFEVRLKKVKLGEPVKLENIKFVGDEVAFLPVSRPTLLSLYRFMLDNPTAKIMVNGHVNAPDMRNIPKLKKLSKDRAKAVYDYLVEKGIEPSRIEYRGAGNSKMVYKKPLNAKQEEENRRVEISVIEL